MENEQASITEADAAASAWVSHQKALEALLDQLEGMTNTVELLDESPAASQCVDKLDEVVDAARDVVDSTDALEEVLGLEDDDELLEPEDYENWPEGEEG